MQSLNTFLKDVNFLAELNTEENCFIYVDGENLIKRNKRSMDYGKKEIDEVVTRIFQSANEYLNAGSYSIEKQMIKKAMQNLSVIVEKNEGDLTKFQDLKNSMKEVNILSSISFLVINN